MMDDFFLRALIDYRYSFRNVNSFLTIILIMVHKIHWLKYLSPLIGILFCPITILFLWSIWSAPVVESETKFIEELQL